MENHCTRLIGEMLELIEQYVQGRLGFARLVNGLEGLVRAADFNDESIVKGWYAHWTPLEIRNAVDGDGVKRADVEQELAAMVLFLRGLLA